MSDAMKKLQQNLEVSLKNYSEVDSRYGSAMAIVSVTEYLLDIGVDPRLLPPLQAAASAIVDEKTKRGAMKPFGDALLMARASAAVDLLMRRGLNRDAAAQRIARATGGGISRKQLLEFRANLGKGKARKEAIEAYYEVKRSGEEEIERANDEFSEPLSLEQQRQIVEGVVKKMLVVGAVDDKG